MTDAASRTSLARRPHAATTVAALGPRLSDRAIAWIFITPTILLLLAINIFPLLWAIYLSFTNYRANRPGVPIQWVGLRNYQTILGNEDIWGYLQVTAHFVFWSILLQVVLGFGLALLINKRFRGHATLTTLILLPMMLSPAVVGVFWTYLFQPQNGIFNYIVEFFTGIGAADFTMIGSVILAPWAIVLVDTWMWTPYVMLICLAGLRSIPDHIYEAAEVDRASAWRQFWHITVPMVLPFLMLAVLFRAIENFKMFDMVVELTSGGPGTMTETISIYTYVQGFQQFEVSYTAAVAFLVIFLLTIIVVWALKRMGLAK